MPKYMVERSIKIEKNIEEVFSYIRDFHRWKKWSPWLYAEKTARVSISDEGNDENDIFSWNGKIVGKGEIEHKTLIFPTRIQQEVRFQKPFPLLFQMYWKLEKQDYHTQLTWKTKGRIPFFLFFLKKKIKNRMERDFERGLKMIKEDIETGEICSQTEIIGEEHVPAISYIAIERTCAINELSEKMSNDFQTLLESEVVGNGFPFSIYSKFNTKKHSCTYRTCLPIEHIKEGEQFFSDILPETRALKIIHKGSYEYLENSWMAGYWYIQHTKGMRIDKKNSPFEIYKNTPSTTLKKDLLTEIYIPIR